MTYEEVALEEIKNDYPKAYEILKDALPTKFIPFLKEITISAKGLKEKSIIKDSGGVLTLQAGCVEGFEQSEEGLTSGVLKLGTNHYKIKNAVLINKGKYEIEFRIEKVEVI